MYQQCCSGGPSVSSGPLNLYVTVVYCVEMFEHKRQIEKGF